MTPNPARVAPEQLPFILRGCYVGRDEAGRWRWQTLLPDGRRETGHAETRADAWADARAVLRNFGIRAGRA